MKLFTLNFLFYILLIPVQLPAQLIIKLPDVIEISVNDQKLSLSRGRLDSLRQESRSGNVHYKIAGIEASQQRAQVRLAIPQIFSLPQVFDQVIFYYSLMSAEDDRRRDQLYIYPYFADTDQQPYITCTYQPVGKFFFTVGRWPVIPVPPAPDLQQRDIYNQIINELLDDYQIMESINPEIIQRIAQKNKLQVEQVQNIYENTLLWQEAQ
jgi:hypothetical protein